MSQQIQKSEPEMTTPRTIAIGDLHGCSIAMAAIINLVDPLPDDTIITLGDYVDRGWTRRASSTN
jgi:hypothetical protein